MQRRICTTQQGLLVLNNWDRAYMQLDKVDPLPPLPKPPHWGWQVLGMVLAMLVLAFAGAWIAEGLT